eukprot:jgi/Mesen1/7644/ME000004S07918
MATGLALAGTIHPPTLCIPSLVREQASQSAQTSSSAFWGRHLDTTSASAASAASSSASWHHRTTETQREGPAGDGEAHVRQVAARRVAISAQQKVAKKMKGPRQTKSPKKPDLSGTSPGPGPAPELRRSSRSGKGPMGVLSPGAGVVVEYVRRQTTREGVWAGLDDFAAREKTAYHDTLSAIMELRRREDWTHVIQMYEWWLTKNVFPIDVSCYNLLMDAYGKARQPLRAQQVFDSMRPNMCIPTDISYNVLMHAYSLSGHLDAAERVYEAMRRDGYTPEMSYQLVSQSGSRKRKRCSEAPVCSRAGQPQGAQEVFAAMSAEEGGVKPDIASYNILLDAFATQGLHAGGCGWGGSLVSFPLSACEASMRAAGVAPTLRTYTILLGAYARAGRVGDAEHTVQRLEARGPRPDVRIYNRLLHAYGAAGQLAKMEALFREMRKGPLFPDAATYTTLVDAYGAASCQEKAEELFAELLAGGSSVVGAPGPDSAPPSDGGGEESGQNGGGGESLGLKPNTEAWTALIGVYSKKKLYRKAVGVFRHMLDARCRPDYATRRVLLAACRSPEQEAEVEELFAAQAKRTDLFRAARL